MTDETNEETNQQIEPQAPDPDVSRSERVLHFVVTNLFGLIALVAGVIAVALFTGWTPDLSREALLVAVTAVAMAPLGWSTGGRILRSLGDEMFIYVVDVDCRYPGNAAIYEFPPEQFRDLEAVDGEIQQESPNLYFAKDVDLQNLTCTGTWRGTLSDRKLLSALTAVFECRGMLEEDARRAFAYETSFWSITYRATKDATMDVVNTFQSNTLPDEGEGVDRAVNDALDEFGLEDRLDDFAEDVDVDLDDLDDALEQSGDSSDRPDPKEQAKDQLPIEAD